MEEEFSIRDWRGGASPHRVTRSNRMHGVDELVEQAAWRLGVSVTAYGELEAGAGRVGGSG
jgi:hypothetical protein